MDLESVAWQLAIDGYDYGYIASVAMQRDLSLEGAMRHILDERQRKEEFIASLNQATREIWYPSC